MAEILAVILLWIKNHVALIFMGIAGSIVGAILFNGTIKQKLLSFVVGSIMALCLADMASNVFYNGEYIGFFGFCIGISGMTLARILLIYIDKFAKSKAGIESKEGE